jgi:benzoyl-CoA reductase/2-hydroxyglutaryl-CoA dehydratase subunit BcrC/BadD/HgdB
MVSSGSVSPASPAVAAFAEVLDTFVSRPESAAALLPQGRPVVGYFDSYFPVELALAAGAVPVKVRGDPHRPIELASRYLDEGANPRVMHAVDAILAGRLGFVDLFCVTGGDSWSSSIDFVFAGLADIEPGLAPLRRYYLERGRAKFQAYRDYNRDRLAEFAGYLGDQFGRPVGEEGLREAIIVTNETRRLLREIAALRARPVPELSGTEGAVIACAATLMDPADFNHALGNFLAARSGPSHGKMPDLRVFVTGSNLDHPELHQLIESCGGVVVGEDTDLGAIRVLADVDATGDPIEALADHYTYTAIDSWLLGMESRVQAKVEAAVSASPDVAVFFHLRGDSAVGWDFPDQRNKLDAAGISVQAFTDQPYAVRGATELHASLRRFVESSSIHIARS